MTNDQFAEALACLVGEAEDAGLDPHEILAEMVGIANMEVVVALRMGHGRARSSVSAPSAGPHPK